MNDLFVGASRQRIVSWMEIYAKLSSFKTRLLQISFLIEKQDGNRKRVIVLELEREGIQVWVRDREKMCVRAFVWVGVSGRNLEWKRLSDSFGWERVRQSLFVGIRQWGNYKNKNRMLHNFRKTEEKCSQLNAPILCLLKPAITPDSTAKR